LAGNVPLAFARDAVFARFAGACAASASAPSAPLSERFAALFFTAAELAFAVAPRAFDDAFSTAPPPARVDARVDLAAPADAAAAALV
jgi:hypothetical protein